MRWMCIVGLGVVACTGESVEETGDITPIVFSWEAGDTSCRPEEGNSNGPAHRDLQGWVSEDGIYFDAVGAFQRCADVPSLAAGADGEVLAAFQAFVSQSVPEQWDRIAIRRSGDDGRTWGEVEFVTIDGLPEAAGRPFDPTVVYNPRTKGWHLYFSMGWNGTELDDSVCTYSAQSSDGVAYTWDPYARFCAEGMAVIDPAVIRAGDTWWYSAPRGAPQDGAYFAVSDNGLQFTERPLIPSDRHHNWTGNFVASDEGVRFYGAEGNYPEDNLLWYSESVDGGLSWSEYIRTDVPAGKDPGITRLSDGMWLMLVPEAGEFEE